MPSVDMRRHRSGKSAFTLLEALTAAALLIVCLTIVAMFFQMMSQNGRISKAQREIRQEAATVFSQLAQDLQGMPLRADLDYRFGEGARVAGAECLFITEQTAPPSLSIRAGSAAAMRGFSVISLKVGTTEGGSWAGLQRGLGGLTLEDYFMGLQPPPNVVWESTSGAGELPRLGKVTPHPNAWVPQSLLDWPLPEQHFAPISPSVVAIGFAFQLSENWVDTGNGGVAYPAGTVLARPPVLEKPPGSGEWRVSAEHLGSIVVCLAMLPEHMRRRLTNAELAELSLALEYPGPATTPTELPLTYWKQRAGPAATTPLEGIRPEIRRELRFEQRLIRVGSGY